MQLANLNPFCPKPLLSPVGPLHRQSLYRDGPAWRQTLPPLYREKFDRARAKNISHLAIAVKLLKYSRDCQDIPYLKADYTQNLVEYLLDLHRLQGRQDDLEAAIVYATETLRLPNTNPLIDERLRNLLATALFTRFKVFDSQTIWSRAADFHRTVSEARHEGSLQSGVMIMLSKIYMALARKKSSARRFRESQVLRERS